jgi:hypothetical protein
MIAFLVFKVNPFSDIKSGSFGYLDACLAHLLAAESHCLGYGRQWYLVSLLFVCGDFG